MTALDVELETFYSGVHSARAEEKINSTFSFQIWYQSKILLSLVQSSLGPVSNIP